MEVLSAVNMLIAVVPQNEALQKQLGDFVRQAIFSPSWRQYELLTQISDTVYTYIGRSETYQEEWKQHASDVIRKAFDAVHGPIEAKK